LAIVVFPNLIALLLLSGQVAEMTRSYFERRPREEDARVHGEMKAKAGQWTVPPAFVARALCVLICCSPQRRRGGGERRELNRPAAGRAARPAAFLVRRLSVPPRVLRTAAVKRTEAIPTGS